MFLFLSRDGKIYGIPFDDGNILIIDPVTNTFTTITGISGFVKWTGGVLAPNGKIYGIPRSSTSVLIIKTGIPVLEPRMLAPEFNRY